MTLEPWLEVVDSVESTNDTVAAWIRSGCVDGRALLAREQRGGRGRRGRRWVSPPGEGLTMSMAVTGARYQAVMLQLPLAAAVGAASAITSETGADVRLKWPNDLLIDGRKVGGILCEAVIERGRFLGVVVGLGVNVNTPVADLPEELRGRATSLLDATGRRHDPEALAGVVRREIAAAAKRLALPDVAGVLAEFEARDVTVGRAVVIDGHRAVAVGIAADGTLEVQGADGARRTVSAGDVVFDAGSDS